MKLIGVGSPTQQLASFHHFLCSFCAHSHLHRQHVMQNADFLEEQIGHAQNLVGQAEVDNMPGSTALAELTAMQQRSTQQRAVFLQTGCHLQP